MDTQKHLHKRRLLDGGDQGPHNRLEGLLLLISGLMFTLESFQSVSVDPDRFFLGRHSLLITFTAGQAVGAILGGLVSQSNQLLKALSWTYAIAFIGFAAQQAAPAATAADGGRSGWAGGAGALLGGAGAAGAAVAGAAALAAAAAATAPRRRAALLAIAYLFSSLGPILSSLIKSLTPAWSRAAAVALALAPGALLPRATAAAAAAAPPVGAGGKAGGGGGGEEEEEEEKEEDEAPAPLRLYRRPLLILMTLWFLQGVCLQGIATIVTDLFKGYTMNTESQENDSAVSAIQNSMLLACFQALGINLALRALAGPKAARHGSAGPVLAAAAAAAGAEGGSAATSATAGRAAALATALGAAAAGLLAAAAAGRDAGGEGVKVAYCTIQGATFAAGAILLVWTLESIPMHLRAKGLGFTIAASYVGCLSSLALFNSSLNDDDGIIGHVFSYIGNGKRLPVMCCSAASATLGALIALVVMRRRVFFEGGDSKLSAVSDTCEAATTYRSFSLPAETMCGS